jgi:UV DNA damage endonuclease
VPTPARRGGGRRRAPDALPCADPTPELLASLASYTPPPLPVPNLGYACLCMELRELKPPVFTSRGCIKRTLDAKGLPHLGELCLANCRDLAKLVQWNHEPLAEICWLLTQY